MSVLSFCDTCQIEITDGVELIVDYISNSKTRERHTIDCCLQCSTDEVHKTLRAPRFNKMFVTKLGPHHLSDDYDY